MKPRAPPPVLLILLCLTGCSGEERDEVTADATQANVGAADAPPPADSYDSIFAAAEQVYFAGEYDSAQIVLERTRVRARQDGEAAVEARALTWIGLAHWRLGDHVSAARVGEEALALKVEHSLTDQYFRSYNALGLLAWTENRLSDAENWFERAATIAGDMGDRRARATALGNLALVQTELGQFGQARAGFDEMRIAMAELGEVRLEANALTNLGMLEIRLGDPRAALPLLNQALALYESIDYGTGTQAALGQLGVAYTDLGDPRQAFAVLDSAFALATRQGLEQERASILEATAELYRAAGDFSRALQRYDAAKKINAELGLDIETGADLRGEADIYIRLGDLERARDSAVKALEIHDAAGAPMDVLLDLLVLADVLDRLDAGEEVEVHLARAREVADELGARSARVELGLAESRIADRHRRSSEVLEIIRRIEPDLVLGGFEAEWEARLLESRAYQRLGRTVEAAEAGRRALATVERVRRNFGSRTLRTAMVSDRREVYSQLISVLLRSGQLEEAFAVSDAARGRVLLEHLPAAAGDSPAGPGRASAFSEGGLLLSRIDQLVESIDYLEETPPEELTPDQARELRSLYARLTQARREYEGLLVLAAEKAPDEAAFLGGARADVAAVRDALSGGQLLVEYFVPLDGPAVLFAVSRNEVRALEAPIDAANLASRVRLARDLINRPAGADNRLDRLLGGLYEALLEPLLNAGLLSSVDELIVVPHRELVYLPFAALRDRTTGRYVIQDHAVRMLPSAAALSVLARRPAVAGSELKGSAFAPFPDRLPATRLELDAVAAEVRGIERHLGAQATESAARRALERPGLVHLATHGVLNVRNPMFSRLELARNHGTASEDDGRLEVHELLELSIEAPLVYLSGCETGAGAAHATSFAVGADFATLAQAILYAGAATVIATLWPVQDAGAAEFATHFYRNLGESSPTFALAAAQRAMLNDQRFGRPYFWAGFQLAGDPGRQTAHIRPASSVSFEQRRYEHQRNDHPVR